MDNAEAETNNMEMDRDHTEPKGTSKDRTHNDVIQCSPKTNPNQRQNLKCKLCNWESGLIKLSKGRQRIKAHNFKHHTNKKDVEAKETNINENHTESECYPTAIKLKTNTKRKIRRSKRARSLLAINSRINGSFTSSTSSSSSSSSDSSDSDSEPPSVRNSLNYSSNSDYEILSSANLEHESDSEFYTNPYIDSDGEIYYGDARPAD